MLLFLSSAASALAHQPLCHQLSQLTKWSSFRQPSVPVWLGSEFSGTRLFWPASVSECKPRRIKHKNTGSCKHGSEDKLTTKMAMLINFPQLNAIITTTKYCPNGMQHDSPTACCPLVSYVAYVHKRQNLNKLTKRNLNLICKNVITVHVCIYVIVHNCHTQHSTEQF